MARILTGIQASGNPHIGNYFGAIKPMIELQNSQKNEMFFFLADLHAFTTKRTPEEFSRNQKNAVLDFLALGINPEISVFYRQSDIRAHTELAWFLACRTNMGLLERAHSYKDKTAKGLETNVGLFTYPVLMAADILLYDAEVIPVGKDQKQHVEMAKDIAQKFNHEFGETFTLPEPKIDENMQTIQGLDGAKMSKSYGNTIEIFCEESVLKKKIMSIKTESIPLGTPICPETCPIFFFHRLFENPNLLALETKYKSGEIGFGESKKQLFDLIWEYFRIARTQREKLEKNPLMVEEILRKGAQKAIHIAEKKLEIVRSRLGLATRIMHNVQ